jgi:hypothetical protein
LRLADYAKRLLCLAETVHRWLGALAMLDDKRRVRVAGYAERIADTISRAADALHRLDSVPKDARARRQAIRELGRIAGYIETMVTALEHSLDGRKLAGVKRRLEQLRPSELHECVVSGRKPRHTDCLTSAEGYFRALADGLRT